MAMLGLSVPPEVCRVLEDIELPGEMEHHKHVTIINFGDDIPISRLAAMMVAAYSVAATWRPFTVQTNLVSCFPKGKNGVPIVGLLESESLHSLHGALCRTLDSVEIDYSKKFPVYRPHVTLSWAQDPIPDLPLPPVSWGAHELVLWGGNRGDGRVIVHLPFSLQNRTASRAPTVEWMVRRLLKARVAQRFLTQ